jgi:endonuclease/exonuclease/phosphatase family metal-dependent hydrolase
VRLKLGLINIQSAIGTTKGYWQYLLHLPKYFLPHSSRLISDLAEVVKREELDLVALAEIDAGSWRTRYIDQLDLLAKASKLPFSQFFPAFKLKSIANQGNAIISNFSLDQSLNHRLSGTGEPRYLAELTVNLKAKSFKFLVTHLSLDFVHRQKQIKEVSEIINKIKKPVVLAGDFNVGHQRELELLTKSKLTQVVFPKSFPSWKPQKHLDYFFFSPEFKLISAEALPDKLADHLLVKVEVEI